MKYGQVKGQTREIRDRGLEFQANWEQSGLVYSDGAHFTAEIQYLAGGAVIVRMAECLFHGLS